jgi:glycosyltransferase involved in cell wall biosynthesis
MAGFFYSPNIVSKEINKMKVAIVHYWLVNMRGGEKVLEAFLEMFPQADIYTHVYNHKAISELIKRHNIYTSHINRLPFAKKLYQLYMPLMPNALMDFNLQSYDLVISSESGPAKGVVPNPNAYHLCYCHTPMRYLWDMYHEYYHKTSPLIRFFMKRLIPGLRLWDVVSSNLVDCFIANSQYVARRIQRCYNREAVVVFPPVNIEKYLQTTRKPQGFYLFFGQLNGYKREDIAIQACVKSGRKLVIAGSGKNKEWKKYKKNDMIKFMGRVTDEQIINLFSTAKALLFPGIEDFGIVPVEAQAAGCPVIAYRDGGALDTVKEGITGVFFNEQSAESLIGAMDYFKQNEYNFCNRQLFSDHVQKFSKTAFIERINRVIEKKERI